MMFRLGLILPFLAFTASTVSAMEDKNFYPLSCNDSFQACVPWFPADLTQEVEVPCGACYTLDVPEGTDLVSFAEGLNVIGKLVVDKPVNIETKRVIVQGELHLNSNKVWDGTQDITITLFGKDDQYFTPAGENAMKCGGNPCKIGKKPFAVAGGKLLVNGMPSQDYDTPTWVHLQEAKSSGVAAIVEPNEPYPGLVALPECPLDGNLLIEDFSSPSTTDPNYYQVESSLGVMFEYTGSTLKVHDRKDSNQGPVFDLGEIMHCVKPNVRYEVNAHVKMYREEIGPDQVEDHACDGSGCLDIKYIYNDGSHSHSRYAFMQEKSHGWKYGEEIVISDTFVFDEAMVDGNNVFSTWSLVGLNAGVAIEVSKFEFKLAPEAAYRTNVDSCVDLALPNGDAELDTMSPFPYSSKTRTTSVTVGQDFDNLDNHYIKIRGRTGRNDDSLKWDLGVGCMTPNTVYQISVDYRLFPHELAPNPENYGFNVRLYVKHADGSADSKWMTECKGLTADDMGVWQTCEGAFTVPDGLVREGDVLQEISFFTEKYVDIDVDNISIAQASGPIDSIAVSDQVDGKWAAGAEVLVTSHTTNWKDDQVRTIVDIIPGESGFVDLVLNETIVAPTSMKDDPNYATEVALLSRNIRIQGADDGDEDMHGGHLIIMHTPGDGQSIVGLEVTNMGQAGNLGRYPLHFHMCGDVTGSKLAKNLIRGTNQRCTVVHATDHLLVDNNVAYDTFGHCFMVEDGMEQYNTFQYNLGSRTKRAIKVIPNLPAKNNGDETDGSAATFWITNPNNYYVGNVAAGGERSGFWYELRRTPRGTMAAMYDKMYLKSMGLGSFKDNVAHSYASAGLRTYPFGYAPNDRAIFENSRTYRNAHTGFFIHNSRNIQLNGFHFADNEVSLDLDRIDLFGLKDSEIVGRSEDYKSKVLEQKAGNVCGHIYDNDFNSTIERKWPLVNTYVMGIEMHTFTTHRGITDQLQGDFDNVKFSRFDDTGCHHSSVFWADDEVRYSSWDYWSTIKNSQADGVGLDNIANFCRAVNDGIYDSYITDNGSTFGQALGISGGVSTIMSYTDTHNKLQAFVEPTLCQDNVDDCMSYCENTCLRTLTVRVDPTVSPDYKLKVCKQDGSKCETYNNWLNTGDWGDRYRIFTPALPQGDYTAEFLDENNQVSWPHGVNATYEVDTCGGSGLQEGAVQFNKPAVTAQECQNLIRNGDAEASSSDPLFWSYERNMGVEVAQGEGIGGSNAFADVHSQSHDDGLSQHLDNRCFDLNKGREYEVRAWVKLIDAAGEPVICDPSIVHSYNCPRIMLHYGKYRLEGQTWLRDSEIEAGITRASNTNDDGYQLLQGVVTVDERLSDASNVRMFVERRHWSHQMYVDNISMTLVSESTCGGGEELIVNGDFETGTSENWNDRDAEGFHVVSPGVGGSGYALKMKTGSAQQKIESGCVQEGKRYSVGAKFRMLDHDGTTEIKCNPLTNNPRCPEVAIIALDENNKWIDWKWVAKALDSSADTADGYSTIWGIWSPEPHMAAAANLYLTFVHTGPNLIIDDVSFHEMGGVETRSDGSTSCGDIIVNGDNELGISGFWSGHGVGNDKLSTTTGFGGSGNAVKVTGRTSWWHGMWYSGENYMNKESCLVPGSKWQVSAQVKLLDQGTENGASCDITEKMNGDLRCPRLRVRFYTPDDPYTPLREEFIYGYSADWNQNGWNEFMDQVEIPSVAGVVINKVAIVVGETRAGTDIVVDDLAMVQI